MIGPAHLLDSVDDVVEVQVVILQEALIQDLPFYERPYQHGDEVRQRRNGRYLAVREACGNVSRPEQIGNGVPPRPTRITGNYQETCL